MTPSEFDKLPVGTVVKGYYAGRYLCAIKLHTENGKQWYGEHPRENFTNQHPSLHRDPDIWDRLEVIFRPEDKLPAKAGSVVYGGNDTHRGYAVLGADRKWYGSKPSDGMIYNSTRPGVVFPEDWIYLDVIYDR